MLCYENWIKAIITLGLRDEELIRKVTVLPNGARLQKALDVCES